MRRLALLALPVTAAALLAAGCGGGSSSASPEPSTPPATTTPAPPAPKPVKPWRTFRKQELPKLALQPKNAPSHLRYLRAESGAQALGDVLVLPSQQREARSYGPLGIYDAVFAARDLASDQRVAQRIWLFKTRKGAKGWLKKTEQDSVKLEFAPIDAPALGEESWAGRGIIQVGGGQSITHAFRLGNAVFIVSSFGDQTPPTELDALAAAKAALVRAESVSQR